MNRSAGFPEVAVSKVTEMTAVQEIVETEQERVERWRAEELMRAGYDPASAHDLASRADILSESCRNADGSLRREHRAPAILLNEQGA